MLHLGHLDSESIHFFLLSRNLALLTAIDLLTFSLCLSSLSTHPRCEMLHLCLEFTHFSLLDRELALHLCLSLGSLAVTSTSNGPFLSTVLGLLSSNLGLETTGKTPHLRLSGLMLLRSLLHASHLLFEGRHHVVLSMNLATKPSLHALFLGFDVSHLVLHPLSKRLHLGLSSLVLLGTLLHPQHLALQSSHLGLFSLQMVSILLAILGMLLLSITLDLGLLLLCSLCLGFHPGSKSLQPSLSSLVLCRSMLHLGHLDSESIHFFLLSRNLALLTAIDLLTFSLCLSSLSTHPRCEM